MLDSTKLLLFPISDVMDGCVAGCRGLSCSAGKDINRLNGFDIQCQSSMNFFRDTFNLVSFAHQTMAN